MSVWPKSLPDSSHTPSSEPHNGSEGHRKRERWRLEAWTHSTQVTVKGRKEKYYESGHIPVAAKYDGP